MKRILAILTLLTLISTFIFAEEYHLVEHYQIGPGTYYSYYEEYTRPWSIYVTEIDLKNPHLKLKTVKAQDKLRAFEDALSMSKRNDAEGHRVVMGTNGDFYNTSTGIPSNLQVSNGEFIHAYTTNKNAFTYSEGGIPDICSVIFSGKIIAKNTSDEDVLYTLSAVNRDRSANGLVMYNNYYGSSTGTSAGGFECLVTPVSDWYVNDTVFAVIETCEASANRSIPNGKFVLSGVGNAKDFLEKNCAPGDTIRIVQELADSPRRLTQLMGGGVFFLRNGVDVVSPSDVVRHPRTGVGFSADSTKLFLMVVDGRAPHSIGMDYHHMADFFSFMGAAHALNLDGGGSSTMVVRNSIMNKPSDGSERKNSNGMLCISDAPNGDFTHIQIPRDSIAVYKNKTVYIGASGWDENYNPASLPAWNDLTVSYDNTLGNFDANQFTALEKNGDTYLKVAHGDAADSLIVHIIELTDLSVYPDTLTLDSVNSIQYEVKARNEAGEFLSFRNHLFKFSVLDPTIADISDEGVIIGKKNGETAVIIGYGEEKDTVHAIIQIGSGEVVIDELESLDAWTIRSDEYINDDETSVSLCDRIAGSGTKAIKVDYSRTGREDGNIYLETEPVDLYGVPSDILIDIQSDNERHW
ncbi:MAG: phosphodiester glycosidase family protein, partial [Candidatus Neomarinimicrobiota bacterium]